MFSRKSDLPLITNQTVHYGEGATWEEALLLSAFPARTRQLLCLVGAEVSASPGAWPQPRPPDDLGLRYRYQLTSVSPLGIGPAALTALLAGAALAGSGTATGPGGARVRARQT